MRGRLSSSGKTMMPLTEKIISTLSDATPVFVVLILVAALSACFRRFGKGTKKNGNPPAYFQKTKILTDNEKDFFGRLSEALGSDFYVFPQMAFSAFITHAGQSGFRYRYMFNTKRADFVVCDSDLNLTCLIELDDASHKREKDAQRDALLLSVGIPCLRYESRHKPASEKIRSDVLKCAQGKEKP